MDQMTDTEGRSLALPTKPTADPEVALRESEERFRAIFEGAAIGIALTDLDGRIVETNRAMREMLGYGGHELRGTTFTAITHPDDVAADMELGKQLETGIRDHYQFEKRYVRADGQVVWSNLTVSLVRSADGDP